MNNGEEYLWDDKAYLARNAIRTFQEWKVLNQQSVNSYKTTNHAVIHAESKRGKLQKSEGNQVKNGANLFSTIAKFKSVFQVRKPSKIRAAGD